MENEILNKESITSLELLKQINLFREQEGRSELEHSKLLRTIRDEFEEEIGQAKIGESSYINTQNKEQPMFVLTLPQAKQVLVRESKFVRKAVIHYIEELENKIKEQQLQLSQVEKLRLQLFSDNKFEVVEAHRQLMELEKAPLIEKIEQDKPKIEAYDTYMNADGTYTVTNACKMLELNRNDVFKWLRDKEYIYKNKTEATAKGVNKGYFKMVIKAGYSTLVITPQGIEFIRKNFKEESK